MYLKQENNNQYSLEVNGDGNVADYILIQQTKTKTINNKKEDQTITKITPSLDPIQAIKRIQRNYRLISQFKKYKLLRSFSSTGLNPINNHFYTRAIQIKEIYVLANCNWPNHNTQLKLSLYNPLDTTTQNFEIDNFSADSQEDYEEKIKEILKNVVYITEKNSFEILLKNQSNTKEPVKIDSQPKSCENLNISKPQSLIQMNPNCTVVCKGTRKIEKKRFNFEIFYNNLDRLLEVFAFVNGRENDILKLKIEVPKYILKKNIGVPDTIIKFARKIYRWVTVNRENQLEYKENMQLEYQDEDLYKKNISKLTQFQSRLRKGIARNIFNDLLGKERKSIRLVTQFAIKLGKSYHLIKVSTDINRPGILLVKSNKANNVLELKLKKIGMEDVDSSGLYNFISLIKQAIFTRVAFITTKKKLTEYSRVNKH